MHEEHESTRGQGLSRREALVKGALGAGAAYGAAAIGPYAQRALGATTLFHRTEVDTLNLLLKYEHIEIAFFEVGKERLKPTGELKEVLDLLEEEERQHAAKLVATIKARGGTPVEVDTYAFAYHDNTYEFLQMARILAGDTVAAYNGAIAVLKSEELIALAASILQVEGRHAATVGMLSTPQEPTFTAFEPIRVGPTALRSIIRWAGPFY